MRQLNNGVHYEKIDSINLDRTYIDVRNHVACMYLRNDINKTTFDYLYDISNKAKTPYIYFLPNIHKVKGVLQNMDPLKRDPNINIQVPARPIISQCGAPTEKIGRFLDYFLKPIVKKQNTYIKDTRDFINKIERLIVPKSALLVTYDVTSLYTNLRFNDLLSSLRYELENNMDIKYDIPRPSTENLVKIAELMLKNNEFMFDEQPYRQIIGAPQGAVPSPEICDIAIFRHINSILDRYDDNDKILTHVRFRDDGFIILNCSKASAMKLFEIANSAHDLLKFTFEISENLAIFLDTELYKGTKYKVDGTLDIKCHTKPTDTFQFLHRNSAHPPSVFKSFITGEMHRFLRNTNTPCEYAKKLDDFKSKLIQRGYKISEINKCFRRLHFNDRKTIMDSGINGIKRTGKTRITFSTKYHPGANRINRCLRKHWGLIENDRRLCNLFPTKIMTCYKKKVETSGTWSYGIKRFRCIASNARNKPELSISD